MSGKLIVSVSGIGERTLAGVEEFCAEMDARSVPVSLLVAPRLKGDYRLDRDPAPSSGSPPGVPAETPWYCTATTKRPPRNGAANLRRCLPTRPTCG
ncbi:hypothetical protein I545_5770 [Mycobacterium kansasii 662]|uniref:Uncharacterized protein n=2 Tax=Mycobacterium kansasii TaxID=1768 RepID=A0A1V3X8Y5_MYCKA|nr:hypothetical protein I545_5770 [Mycobacterium kansasii 662]OOK70163.1 hypothetical protein BZL30_6598 [Mycobacterium kansasii]OOK74921.1 hypothetical protein BZL29_4589 [Mycobacterium kansasii]